MYSQEFMSYLMSNPIEKSEKKEKDYLKKGLAGILNYINANISNEQKVYHS